jgi:NAD(P)-dependent dehydrogenase (short-subunit alcohol dehydrogenase family)
MYGGTVLSGSPSTWRSGMDAERFRERVVMVTGGASGIGAATAQRFAAEGAAVVAVCDTNLGLAEEIAAGLTPAQGVAYRLDVTDLPGTEAVVADLTDRFGSVDVLVSAAGDHDDPIPEPLGVHPRPPRRRCSGEHRTAVGEICSTNGRRL